MSHDKKELYYLQRKGYVGNCLLWWALKSQGYTCDISRAQLYEREEAENLANNSTDTVPWPKEYIDKSVRPMVDHQIISEDGTADWYDPILPSPKASKRLRCGECGVFQTLEQHYLGCANCGAMP